ncbi:hypothetical protein GGF50DRAFT_100381 [Schizophyllum commune]
MAMSAPVPRPTPPSGRRNTLSSPTSASIARGATARAAASPRVSSALGNGAARRNSLRAPTPPTAGQETKESLATALKQEVEQKEHLLVQVQDKEQTISTLASDNDKLTSSLHAAETRLNELYADQERSERELAQRIEVAEKLRTQVRELEKEKRDLQRRYNEQTATFEAERQAFYDNEQHLKSRIQTLSQAKKADRESAPADEPETDVDEEPDTVSKISVRPPTPKQETIEVEEEPAEMTSLRLELSTLSTSYSSMQSTLVLLQGQLNDLKRVNNELQEENESYMILLRERTLNGQFNVMNSMGVASSSVDSESEEEESNSGGDRGSLRSAGRSTLEKVEEEDHVPETLDQQLERSLAANRSDSPASRGGRKGRRRGQSTSQSPAPRGETLADLPITGPGLDLAAELGRAENRDFLDGSANLDNDQSVVNGNKKRGKKGSDTRAQNAGTLEPSGSLNDIDSLRNEVKALKDANKALSLYASKIVDRILAQEGFEHVLAVDYDKQPTTPKTPAPTTFDTFKMPTKPRPQSAFVGRSSTNPTPDAKGSGNSFLSPKLDGPSNPSPSARASRRSMSFDWRSLNPFGGEKKPEAPTLRPLQLKPGQAVNARKLDTEEDEEDRKERERLQATMKLMGYEPAPAPSPVITSNPAGVQRSHSTSSATPTASAARRWSLFGPRSPNPNDTHSALSSPGLGNGAENPGLTQEALEHVEAQNSLAALDARERQLSAELAKGGSSGFTEIQRRSPGSRRGRRSAGSGSTVWSAGMSGTGEDE